MSAWMHVRLVRRATRWIALLLVAALGAACAPSASSGPAAPARSATATPRRVIRTATPDIGDELNFAPGATATAKPQPTVTPTEDLGDELNFAPGATATLPPPPAQISRSVPDDPALAELSFASGGAAVDPIIGSQVCDPQAASGALTAHVGGVWSTFNRYDPDLPFFWGTKETACKTPVEVGDVVFFRLTVADDSPDLQVSLAGPDGSEDIGFLPVRYVQDRPDRFAPPLHSNAVQLAWLATPDLGIGAYELRVASPADALTLPFEVVEARGPTVGATFGGTGRPFVLGPGESIDLALAGFAPSQTVEVLITQDGIATFEYGPHTLPPEVDYESTPVASLSVTVDASGFWRGPLDWPADLAPGLYSLFVPAVVTDPGLSALQQFQFFSLQFAVQGSDAMTFAVFDPDYSHTATANLTADPSPDASALATLTTDDSGLLATGPSVVIDGVRWVPIEEGGLSGWMRADQIIEEYAN